MKKLLVLSSLILISQNSLAQQNVDPQAIVKQTLEEISTKKLEGVEAANESVKITPEKTITKKKYHFVKNPNNLKAKSPKIIKNTIENPTIQNQAEPVSSKTKITISITDKKDQEQQNVKATVITTPIDQIEKKPLNQAKEVITRPINQDHKYLTPQNISSKKNKTQGHYVEVNLLNTSASFKEIYISDTGTTIQNPEKGKTNFGLGINYKYAFNFNNFFIAPGIFFERNQFGNTQKTNHREASNSRINITNRYGVSFDAGYDLNKYFAPYATIGYSKTYYRTRTGVKLTSEPNYTTTLRDDSENAFLYGFGLKTRLTHNLNLITEYNYQRFNAKTNINHPSFINDKITYRTSIDTIKLGIAYNF